MITWDVLIPSVNSRWAKLFRLLEHLEGQWRQGFGVIVWQDNLQATLGEKHQRLMEASQADYISFLGDDDWVDDQFVPLIMGALSGSPDYVGFKTRFEVGGVVQSWSVVNRILPSTTCVIRRSIATQARFVGHVGEDRRWATDVLATGMLRTEAFIDQDLYVYRHDPNDSAQTGTIPLSDWAPGHPSYGFVTWLDSPSSSTAGTG